MRLGLGGDLERVVGWDGMGWNGMMHGNDYHGVMIYTKLSCEEADLV